jgi:anaerobic magnesium-protoporphyrin IX monomethyl ester cyclase
MNMTPKPTNENRPIISLYRSAKTPESVRCQRGAGGRPDGCPYSCIYCAIPALTNGKWRFRSPEHVLGEMQQVNDLGYRSIYLTDDHFLLKRDRIRSICQGIIDRKLQFSWGCEGRVDSAAVDQFGIMNEANCSFLAFGVESGTQKILDRLDKRQTLAQIENAVSQAKKHGIKRALWLVI